MDEPNGETRVKKPVQAPKRRRRNYAAELADLEKRVDMAIALLKHCDGKASDCAAVLIGTAIATLVDAS